MRIRNALRCAVALLAVCIATADAIEIETIERLVAAGKSAEALPLLEKELAKHPRHSKLLYNYGVACYAAGRFDDALLAFDKVEAGGNKILAEKARAQKGNAEFRLGVNSRADNLDETVERWKTSLSHYNAALKTTPEDVMAKNNHDKVQKLLMEILLKQAQQKLAEGLKNNGAERKIDDLREAMEKFQEATQVDSTSEPAKQGEQQARQELAKTLAKEGEKKAVFKPDQVNDWQLQQIEKGVGMLEDAHDLLPKDKPIEQALENAKENLAKALVARAKQDIQQAEEAQWDRAKFEKLESALDKAEQAQDLDKKNEEAKPIADQAREELAKLHEKAGDQQAEMAERSSLPQQAQRLEAALDHYNEALDIKPENAPLTAKAEQTQEKLANALEKLADKYLEQPKRAEQLEETTARYEQAETTLQDLDQIRPSEKTDQKLDMVGKKLAELRQKLAEQARQQLAMEKAQQEQQNKQKSKQPGQATAQVEEKPDLEQPPPAPKNPEKGRKSDELAKKGKDY